MRSGWFQSEGRSSPHKWKTWEVVQGLIKSSDSAHWEQLSSSLSHNIGNQILLLTFSIKGHLLYGQNDQTCLNHTALNELHNCGQSPQQWKNLVYKISTDIKSKKKSHKAMRGVSDAINALEYMQDIHCMNFKASVQSAIQTTGIH